NNFGTTILTGNNTFKADGTGGKYDLVFDFSGHNFNGGASFTYFISGISGLDAADFAYMSMGGAQYYAAAHIQGLSGGDSTWVDPGAGPTNLMPVPEPSVFALGVVSMGLVALRRHSRKA